MAEAKTLDERHGGITLAEFAELSALARLPAPPFGDMLAARGLSADAWREARAAWNRAIEEHLERGDDALVVAFAAALADAKQRFRRDPPRAPEIPATPPSAASPAPPQLSSMALTPAAAPPVQAVSVGFAPAVVPAPAGLGDTAKMPLQAIISRILPFQPGAAPSAPAAPGASSATPTTSPAPRASTAVPAASVAPSADAATASSVPIPAAVEPSKAPAHLGSTAEIIIPRVLPKPLPFALREAEASRAASPAASSTPASAPRLTLEQYASLTAELAEKPDRTAEVRARYFVAQDAAWAALQAEWQQRMSADPNLRQRVADLVAHYRTWFQRKGG